MPLMVAGLVTLSVASRISIPDVNQDVIRKVMSGGGLLGLYNLIGSGSMARGGILALGVMPYLAARLWIWIARLGNTRPRSEPDRRRMLRDTRLLTVLLTLIQSYGFALFVQRIPGAVANPGSGFILQTMAILTVTSLAAMMIVEQLTPPPSDEDDDDHLDAVAELLGSGPAQPIDAAAEAKTSARSL